MSTPTSPMPPSSGSPAPTAARTSSRPCSSLPERTLDAAALREHCRSCLAAYKVPRRVVAVDDLPRSQIGKVLRKQVRESLIDA